MALELEQFEDEESKAAEIDMSYHHPQKQCLIPLQNIQTSLEPIVPNFDDHNIIEQFQLVLTFLLHHNSPFMQFYTSNSPKDDCTTNSKSAFISRCSTYNQSISEQQINTNMNELYNFYNNLYNEKWDQLYQVIVNNELKDEEYQLSEQDKSHLEKSLGEFKLLQKHSIHTPNAIAKAFSSGVVIDSFALNDKEDIHLQDVECHNDMKLWIEKHKDTQEHNILNIFRDKMDADKLPMSLWSKMDVISFITKLEDIQPHFESVLWQYNINGQDLCDITEEQMEWLMQISIENNHDIDLEDNFISDSKDDEDEFGVKALKSEVNKNRIKSHIVCYYYQL